MNRNKKILKKVAQYLCKACILFVLIQVQSVNSFAQTKYEFWPEVNGFIKLNDQFRFYLVAAYAEGRESDVETLDLAANVDISIKPLLRKKYRQEDWQRSRFLWVRLGYDYVSKQTAGKKTTPENRGMINFFAKGHLPADIWLEARTRVDLRWIGEDYSTRYRLRLEATREFSLFKHSAVPYLNCEVFYDTRYSRWARMLIMAGSEFSVNEHFRFELYLAPQIDYLPERTNLLAFGVVSKLYY